jgi:hypothetical protein
MDPITLERAMKPTVYAPHLPLVPLVARHIAVPNQTTTPASDGCRESRRDSNPAGTADQAHPEDPCA